MKPSKRVEEIVKEFEKKYFVENGELSVESYVDAKLWPTTTLSTFEYEVRREEKEKTKKPCNKIVFTYDKDENTYSLEEKKWE